MNAPATPHTAFSTPEAVACYAESPRRNVPGYDSLLTMSRILLAEHVPDNGKVLVVGAGGGLELENFAHTHANWQFVGVDPSAAMLDVAGSVWGHSRHAWCCTRVMWTALPTGHLMAQAAC